MAGVGRTLQRYTFSIKYKQKLLKTCNKTINFSPNWLNRALIMSFFFKKFVRITNSLYLCTHENPPSLSTMLKCAGRFFIRTFNHGNNNTISRKSVYIPLFLLEKTLKMHSKLIECICKYYSSGAIYKGR